MPLTLNMQKLLLLIKEKGKITIDDQKVYCPKTFSEKITILKKKNLVRNICPVCEEYLPKGKCDNKDINHFLFRKNNKRKQIKIKSLYALTIRGTLLSRLLK